MAQAFIQQAVPWLGRSVAGHVLLINAFNPRPVYVGFVVDRVSLVWFASSTPLSRCQYHSDPFIINIT